MVGPVHLLLTLALGAALPAGAESARVVETVLPALAYSSSCSSTVTLQNLGDGPVVIGVEAHRSSGALVPLAGRPGMNIRLAAGEAGSFRLNIPDEDFDAWVKVRERLPAVDATPVVAVSGASECVVKNELHSAGREVAYPLRSPWFSSEVAKVRGEVLLLINTTANAVRATECYSAAGYYAVVPSPSPPARVEYRPICSAGSEVQIAPFGSRRFTIEGEPEAQYLLRTSGTGIVLQMLRPAREGVHIYTVDSSIRFDEVAP